MYGIWEWVAITANVITGTIGAGMMLVSYPDARNKMMKGMFLCGLVLLLSSLPY